MVAEGYPGAIVKGREISGLENIDESTFIFHAGTALNNGKVVTNGGRVIAVTSLAENMELAISKSM